MLKKMEQAKKKAEAVVNTVDISEREKIAQLKRYFFSHSDRNEGINLCTNPTFSKNKIPTRFVFFFFFFFSIYKKAGVKKEKREVTYVITKKGAGKKVRRPSGVKGVFKVVDSRMKKDMRGIQRKEQRAKGGKGKGKQAKGGKGGQRGGKAKRGK